MAQTALNPTRVQAVGSMTQLLVGVAGGSGTSTTVTLAGNLTVVAAGAMGATSSTSPFVATVSANTFIVTTASNDLFFWIALVKGGI